MNTGDLAAGISDALRKAMSMVSFHPDIEASSNTSALDLGPGRKERKNRHGRLQNLNDGNNANPNQSGSNSDGSISDSAYSMHSNGSRTGTHGTMRNNDSKYQSKTSARSPSRRHGLRDSRASHARNLCNEQRHKSWYNHTTNNYRMQGVPSEGAISSPTKAEEVAGVGRNAIVTIVKITVQAVVGRWAEMATAALKAVRRWQVRCSKFIYYVGFRDSLRDREL